MCQCMNRRQFLVSSGKATLGAAASAACFNSCNKTPGDIVTLNKTPIISISLNDSKYEVLKEVTGAAYVYIDNLFNPLILYRDSEKEIYAYSSECTHLGVPVNLPNDNGLLVCPGDGGAFNVHGEVVADPAPKDLKKYTAVLDGDTVDIYDLAPDA